MRLKELRNQDKLLVLLGVLLDPENVAASLAVSGDLDSDVLMACDEILQFPLELRMPFVSSMLRNLSHVS